MKKAAIFFLPLFFTLSLSARAATLWYVSNAAGQSLQLIYSLAALREKYALSVMTVEREFIPQEYLPYHAEGWSAECRNLYGSGELLRTQWVFIDENKATRFVAAKSPAGDGFTEIYDASGFLTEETRFDAPVLKITTNDAGEEVEEWQTSRPVRISYTYRSGFLTEARSDEWHDIYRYTRANQIRLIDRTYYADSAATRIAFPRSIKDISFTGSFFASPALAYSSIFLKDVLSQKGAESVYTLDNKGRILSERRVDVTGKDLGTMTINWDGDRIASVEWEAEKDIRKIVYIYNKDDERIKELNYRDGVLEREVIFSGDDEFETLYLNGAPALKAVWSGGKKISEENLTLEGAMRRRTGQ